MGFYRCGGLVLQLHRPVKCAKTEAPGPRAPHGLPRGRGQLHRPVKCANTVAPGTRWYWRSTKGPQAPRPPGCPKKNIFFEFLTFF
jgi:hypothetical protein